MRKPWKKKEPKVENLTPPVVKFVEIPLDTLENTNNALINDARAFCNILNDFLWDTSNGENPELLSGVMVGTTCANSIYIPRYEIQMNTAIHAAINSVRNPRLVAAILLGIHKSGTSLDYMKILEEALSMHMPTGTTKTAEKPQTE